MKKFKLIIGDWSNDGHGITSTVVFNSNLTIEELRELYFNQCQKYGRILEKIVSEYEESFITKEQFDTLKNYGYDFYDGAEKELEDEGRFYIDEDVFIDIFIWFMKKDNPTLMLEITDDDVPTFHFYGYDSKSRHIGFFGYGLFS